MISLNSLGFNIEAKSIFKDLSFTCLPGAILYISGSNGSGKTSLLKIIAGIKKATYGHITIGRKGAEISALEAPYVTYIGHNTGIKPELSVCENLSFWANLWGAYPLIESAIAYLKLGHIWKEKAQNLSAGQKKLVAISRLLICPSKIWLLDEVEANLDDGNKELLHHLLISHSRSGGVAICTTHIASFSNKFPIINLDEYKILSSI